jgi:hypothetical protein
MASIPPKVLSKKLEKELHQYLPQDCDHLINDCTRFLSGCPTFITHRAIGVKLCQNYDLSAEELRWKWEAVKRRETHRLDASNIQELKIYIAQEQAKPSRPTNKGSSARLSGVMSVRGAASGYGPGRIPRQLNVGLVPDVKREGVDRPVPVAGSSKISFSQVDKVEKRECGCSTGVNFSYAKLTHV